MSGSITLEAELPPTAKRAAFSQSIINDLAEKMGVDPSRIRITSLDMVEVEVGKRSGVGRRGGGSIGPGGVMNPAAAQNATADDAQAKGKARAPKYSESDLRDKSVGQLRRMCEDESAIEQRDIDDADEARDRTQAFSDLLLTVREEGSGGGGGGGGGGATGRGGKKSTTSKADSKSSGRGRAPEPELEPEPRQSSRTSTSSPSSSKKKKKKR